MESADELLGHLDPKQREIATRFGVPLRVRVGAGTGKTCVITYRIACATRAGVLDPQNVMALTFTSRAAGGLRSRLRGLDVCGASAHTFHAAALRQLGYFWGTAIGGAVPPVAENKLSMVAQVAGQLGMTTDSVSLRDMASEIGWSRVNLVAPDDYPDRALSLQRDQATGYPAEEVARLIRAYEDVKQNRGIIDFEDILLLLIGILIDRPDVARMVRDQYCHFVVDEYQDVSSLQHRLLQLWMGERRDLCVVGDVSQIICSFAGTSSRYLADFAREFRSAQILELIRDYRSSPQIVTCANEVTAPDAPKGTVRLASQLPSSVLAVFKKYGDGVEEAEVAAAEIFQLREKEVGLADIAVLYRTNAQSAEFKAALERAGVDYSIRGSERFFSRHEVREAMVGMRAAARAEAGGALTDDVKAVLTQRGRREQPPEGTGAARERWSALVALFETTEEMERTRGAGMVEFVAELEERAQIQAAPETDSVTLASLHSAEGLEWHAVLLVGMNEGLMPISLTKGEGAIDEERCLMHAGITRAKQCLQISYAEGNGQQSARKMSRFLQGTWPRPSEPASRMTSYRERKAAAARQFVAEHGDDVPLFKALVEWRLEASRHIDEPAYVILHDSTLRTVAVTKPATLGQLGKIRGIDASKFAEWGEEILGVVAQSGSGR